MQHTATVWSNSGKHGRSSLLLPICQRQHYPAWHSCPQPPPPPALTHNLSINPKWAVGQEDGSHYKELSLSVNIWRGRDGSTCTRVRTWVCVRAANVWSEEGIIGGGDVEVSLCGAHEWRDSGGGGGRQPSTMVKVRVVFPLVPSAEDPFRLAPPLPWQPKIIS